MTAPRMFTSLLTEAIRNLAPKTRRAREWADILQVPKGYSRQEYDAFASHFLEDAGDTGNPALSRDRLLEHMEKYGPQSEMEVVTRRADAEEEPAYAGFQRVDGSTAADYREVIPRINRGWTPAKIGPHDMGPSEWDGKARGLIVPAWARMESVMTERGVREPMATQIQSDRRRLQSQVTPIARALSERSGGSVSDEMESAVDFAREGQRIAPTGSLRPDNAQELARPERYRTIGVPENKIPNEFAERNIAEYWSPEPWDAAGGDANYRPAIAAAIRSAIDEGHSRLLFPSEAELTRHMGAKGAQSNTQTIRSETERMLRAVGQKAEWEPATAKGAGADSAEWEDAFEEYVTELADGRLRATLADPNISPRARENAEEEMAMRLRYRGMSPEAMERRINEVRELARTASAEIANLRNGNYHVPPELHARARDLDHEEVRLRAMLGWRDTPDNQFTSWFHDANAEDFPTQALRLDKLKNVRLPILGAAIMAGAGASSAQAQDVPRGTQDTQEDDIPDLATLREAIAASKRHPSAAQEPFSADQAGLVSSEDDGASWGRIGAVAGAIGLAALGAKGIAGKMASKQGLSLPPIPGRGLQDQLTTQAPPTHPATPEEILGMAKYRDDRTKAISRLRSLSGKMDPASEITRDVEDIITNGPSMARQMRSVDDEIADIQESLVRHGLVKGSGRVPNAEWVRMAEEIKVAAGGREFWLDNPDRVMASPELTAAAIVEMESGVAMAHAIRRSLDPAIPFEAQQFAARYADEMMVRMIGSGQRVRRDVGQIGRTMQSLKLLKGLYGKHHDNAATWMRTAEKLAGKNLDEADAHAIAHLVATGDYLAAARKLNLLRDAHWLDKADEAIRSFMQASMMRPFRDLMSNSPNVLDRAVARQLASLVDAPVSLLTSAATGKPVTRTVMTPSMARSAGVMWKGGVTGLKDAVRLLLRRPVEGDVEFMRRVAERMDLTNETTFKHPVTNLIFSQARRWFTAADYPAYRAATNDALAEMAMTTAYNNGARGDQLVKDALALFEHPGPVMLMKAQKEAIATVWQNQTAVSTGWHKFTSGLPPEARFMARRPVPFVHTQASMVSQALNQSPVGTIRTAADLSQMLWAILKKRPDFELQRRAMLRLGAHATGAMWMAAGWMLQDEGNFRGAYDETDSRGNAADEEQNIRPISMRVNGKWYAISMLLGPQAMLMAMGAAMREGFVRMAQQEIEDPTMEKRWYENVGTVAAPIGKSVLGVLEELPMSQGFESFGMLSRDLKQESFGSASGQYLGRMAAQAVPAFVQQAAGSMDRDETGQIVRRDTRGADFNEAFTASIRNAIPGLREDLPVRPTPFGREGTGYDLNVPLQYINPGRTRYREHEDWVVDVLREHDAFPGNTRRLEGETQAEFSERRLVEGKEERAVLERALDGEFQEGEGYDKALEAWDAKGNPIPSPEYTALLRQVMTAHRTRRSAARRQGEP